jgi:hypothetical protein
MFVVVDPRAGVPQPRSEWRTSERALQRAKEPCHTGTPLDEHSQVFFHDLRQDLLAWAVQVESSLLGITLAVCARS